MTGSRDVFQWCRGSSSIEPYCEAAQSSSKFGFCSLYIYDSYCDLLIYFLKKCHYLVWLNVLSVIWWIGLNISQNTVVCWEVISTLLMVVSHLSVLLLRWEFPHKLRTVTCYIKKLIISGFLSLSCISSLFFLVNRVLFINEFNPISINYFYPGHFLWPF